MKKVYILRIVLIVFIICWMTLVFSFSNANGTSSSRTSYRIAKLFSQNEEVVRQVEHIIRKIAHLLEYALGGFLFYALLLTYKIKPKYQIIIASFLGIFYSITDELHQLFVDGRSGKLIDVFIDSIGVIFGICVLLLIIKICKKESIYARF